MAHLSEAEVKEIKQTLANDIGVSATIYALVMPETEAAKNRVIDGMLREKLEHIVDVGGSLLDVDAIIKAVHDARKGYYDQFRGAWTQKQDAFHKEFFRTWFEWAKPIAPVSAEQFKYQYPTAGASEGISAAIQEYGNRARDKEFAPEIFVFNGEYEGYKAFAEASYIPLRSTNRDQWHDMVDAIAEASKDKPVQLYLSQPSAIDGNVWNDYDAFMKELAQKAPNAEVILDLTYVGCIAKEAHINTEHPNIKAVVFSLSKPMGAYYDRIGGLVSKEPYGTLFGNQWFKNITSLNFGLEFIKSHAVHELPRIYEPIQQQAIAEVQDRLMKRGTPIDLKPSDVVLLATGAMPDNPTREIDFLGRVGTDGNRQVRACLTATMARMIGTAPEQELAQLEQEKRER